jgi:O-antigen ligase
VETGLVTGAAQGVWRRSRDIPGDPAGGDRTLAIPFVLILAFIVFEYARPAHVFHVPMVAASVLFVGWLVRREKRWSRQTYALIGLLGVMAVSTFFAPNGYAAFLTTRSMTILFLGVCIPMMHVVDRLPRLRLLVVTWVATFVYVGVYAIGHSGFGPAGTDGAQDENYVGSAMSMALPFAYFSIFVERRTWAKVLYGAACGVFVAATIVGTSRGGFLAMVAVGVYCLMFSPRKKTALAGAAVLALMVLLMTPGEFWEEMATMTDTEESTVDGRIEFWKTAWRMFLDYPVVGIGPGNFYWNSVAYRTHEQVMKLGMAAVVTHSFYFELLAELGLIGCAVVLSVWYWNAVELRTVVRGTGRELSRSEAAPGGRQSADEGGDLRVLRYYALAVGGGLVGLAMGGISLSFLYFSHFWILTAMTVAVKELTARAIPFGMASAARGIAGAGAPLGVSRGFLG